LLVNLTSKRLVRDFLDARTRSTEPPPTPEEIRRQMGWDLIPVSRQPSRAESFK
jgi:hypothetical protein